MSLADLVVVLLAGFASYRGWRKGLLGQLFELGGGFLGLLLGVALGPRIASLFTDKPGPEGALISLFAVFAFLSLGQAAGFIVGHRFGSAARQAKLGHVDQGLGSGFSVIITLVSFWLIGSMLIQGPVRPIAKSLQKSFVLETLNEVLPAPPNVLAYLQKYLNTSGFPQVFAGMPRAPGPPVDLPTDAEARAAARKAIDSTLRIMVPACGGTQLGSGWIAGETTVVTNAHVVAGGEDVELQDHEGNAYTGNIVLFDSRTDIAVIRTTTTLAGPVLELDPTGHDRGEGGATLGYPGSREGALVTRPAAVQARFEAVGKDIYGRRDVPREVYELRARVRQGDSGGPFVLPTGEVAGLVFAASTTDGDIGYALTGSEIEDEVEDGLAATEEVSAGPCTR